MSARLLAAVAALVVSVAVHPRGAAAGDVSFASAGRQAVATLLQVYYAGGGLWRACNAPDCATGNSDWGDDSQIGRAHV